MEKESRVKKSLLNARINLICYFVSLLVAFFTRRIFLDKLGTEFIGLTGTLQSLLGFLNLAELGVGTAIGYVLYKPIFDGNKEKINEIISVFGYLYRCIGFVILGVGFVLSLFLPLIFPNTSISLSVIYMGYYAFLASSLLGYFVNYRMTLLSADQRNYVVTGYFQATTTGKVILQMVLAIFFASFYLYFIIELLAGIINSLLITWKMNQTYPWLRSDVKLGHRLFKKYPEIGRYVKQLFVHKIGYFVQFQVTPFLIYSYVSLPIVALYGNYTILTQRMQSLFSAVLDSVGASVGNLISEGNKEKIYATYAELLAVRMWASAGLTACLYYLITPFIKIWLGEEYVLVDVVVLLILIQFFMQTLRGLTDSFIFGYGLFYDIWAPAVESVLFIVTSMLFGSLWGLSGVLLGPVVSTLIIVYGWKPYFLYSKGFQLPYYRYWILFFRHLFPMALSILVSVYAADMVMAQIAIMNEWIAWTIKAVVFVLIMGIMSLMFMWGVSPFFRKFVYRFVKRK